MILHSKYKNHFRKNYIMSSSVTEIPKVLFKVISKLKEIIIITVVFLSLATPCIDYDNFTGDELVPASLAVNTIVGKTNGRNTGIYINVFGRALAVNRVSDYDFASPSYILLPFIKYFGSSIKIIKQIAVGISLVYVIVLYLLIKRLLGKNVAFITCLLLVTTPLFIHYSRCGFDATELSINLLFTTSMWCLILSLRNRKFVLMIIATLLLGMCLSLKLSVLCRYIGLFVCLLIIYYRETAEYLRKIGHLRIGIILGSICLGAFLFFYYNIHTGGKTLKLVNCLIYDEPTFSGEKNSDLIPHIKLRISHLNSLIKDEISLNRSEKFTDQSVSNTYLYLFYPASIFVLLMAKRGKYKSNKIIYFIYIFFGLMFVTTFFSLGSWRLLHLAMLYPFPQIVIALLIVGLFNMTLSPLIKIAAPLVLFILIMVIKVPLLYQYLSFYSNVAATSYTNDESIRMIAEKIGNLKHFPYVFTDFATEEAVYFITKGEIECFGGGFNFINSKAIAKYMEHRIKEWGGVYLIATEKDHVPDSKVLLTKRYADEKGYFFEKICELRNRNGRTLYNIYHMYP